MKPENDAPVLLKLRVRSLCTRGDGVTPSFWGDWDTLVVQSFHTEAPYLCEEGFFLDGWFIPHLQRHEIELVEWAGFNGGGKLSNSWKSGYLGGLCLG